MVRTKHRFVLELYKEEDSSSLGQIPVAADWEPAREWAWFQGVRRDLIPASGPAPPVRVEPRWHPTTGAPYVDGFDLRLAHADGEEVSVRFSNRYFDGDATRASADLVARHELAAGDRFRYLPAAFPAAADPPGTDLAFATEDATPPLPVRMDATPHEWKDAQPIGPAAAGDQPVFVPRRVLEEAATLSHEAGAKETGGILIGHLRRESADIACEVTAQLPARHTDADLTRLTFTAETWTEVRAALELRRREEIMLGWWHSHPAREWCKGCPPERRAVCTVSGDFYSSHDRALHRTVFPKAYSVGLVVSDTAARTTWSLFGWREGVLEERGFHVVGGVPNTAAPRAAMHRPGASGAIVRSAAEEDEEKEKEKECVAHAEQKA